MKTRIIFLALLLAPAPPSLAQTYIYYKYTSGTGFIVNNEGNVITNAHVVRNCKSISILTPRGEEDAKLVDADTKNDLAVLKTAYIAKGLAPLRWNISDLRVGDSVVMLGYPGREGSKGQESYKKTRIVSLKGPAGEAQWLQLKSVAEHGNSGGPVLDSSGNVIAVITGIAQIYNADEQGHPVGSMLSQSDIAITLPALQEFLRLRGISFYESGSSGASYDDSRLHDEALDYTVPVRCITSTETRS